jgi:hypothetical protein
VGGAEGDLYCLAATRSGVAEAEPSANGIFNCLKLSSRKRSHGPDQSSVGHGDQTLGVKGARLEKPRRYHGFELRPPHTRRVRNQGHERAIRLASVNVQYHARADLGGKPKIDKPDLTARR